MDENTALFVPKYSWKGYNLAIEIIKSDEREYRVFMRPVPGKDFFNEDDLQLMMGLIELKNFPFWIPGKDVMVQKVEVPKYEIQFLWKWKVINFNEAVTLMSSLSAFKLVTKNPGE